MPAKDSKCGISRKEYLADPCTASSLPFWKTEQVEIPAGINVYREDELTEENCTGIDEPYFKIIHYLSRIRSYVLPEDYVLTGISPGEMANHIQECYQEEWISFAELETYIHRDVYDSDLWIAVREKATGKIIASGIGEIDTRIGEGILDWIQVSQDYRHRGFGRIIVSELLRRLSLRATFATVSGRMNNPDNPFGLYQSCGFVHPIIWHVVKKNI